MLLLNRCAVSRIGHNSRFTQIHGCLIGIGAKFLLQVGQTAAEKLKLLSVHVVVIRHLENFFSSENFFGHLRCSSLGYALKSVARTGGAAAA